MRLRYAPRWHARIQPPLGVILLPLNVELQEKGRQGSPDTVLGKQLPSEVAVACNWELHNVVFVLFPQTTSSELHLLYQPIRIKEVDRRRGGALQWLRTLQSPLIPQPVQWIVIRARWASPPWFWDHGRMYGGLLKLTTRVRPSRSVT